MGTVELGVHVERGLVDPPLEQRQLVGIHHALEDLELLAAGLLHGLRAAGLVGLRQLGALAGCRGDGDDESDGQVVSPDLLVRAWRSRGTAHRAVPPRTWSI